MGTWARDREMDLKLCLKSQWIWTRQWKFDVDTPADMDK